MRKFLFVLTMACICLSAGAAIRGPYTVDGNTLHLWHLNETTVPAVNSVSGSINLEYLGNGATLGNASFAGFGTTLNTNLTPRTTQANPYLSPKILATDATDNFTLALCGADGAFTYEAILRLDIDPSVIQTAAPGNAPMQIISGEGETNPERIFQWRLDIRNATLPMRMEFVNVRQATTGQVENIIANLPETGPNAPVQGGWYHAAVVYNGLGNTDNNIKFYWTRLNVGNAVANAFWSGKMVRDLFNINGPTDFTVGNEGRGFTGNGQSDNFQGLIDEIRMSSVALAEDQMMFYPLSTNPSPSNNLTIQNLNLAQLTWTNLPTVTGCTVYFGKADANSLDYKTVLTKIATITSPVIDQTLAIPAGFKPLADNSAYTWVVESVAGDPNATVHLWKFATKTLPIIQTSPDNQFRFPGETAQFVATFLSSSAQSAGWPKWYKETGVVDQQITTADPYVTITTTGPIDGVYTSTLKIINVADADAGDYYCEAKNGGGMATTLPATLIIKKKIAHWNFNGNLNDETGVYNGVADPNVTSGFVASTLNPTVLGQALEFDGTLDYVDLPDGFADFRSGFSFAVWANPAEVTKHARFLDFGNGAPSDNIYLMRNNLSNDLVFSVSPGTATGASVTAANAIELNKWQLFVVTMNETGAATIYKNGLPVANGTVSIPATIARAMNYIGKSNWGTADALYKGQMDDVQMYNYALTADNVADMYVAAAGPFCRYGRPVLDMAGNLGDASYCIVDIADFAVFVSNWLSCGIYPQSACQ